jgi:hypothetical protein
MNDRESRASRKVAVLGPIPRDQVVTHAGQRFHKYGCAIYTAVALSSLLDSGDTVVPISHVRRQDEGPIKQSLESFPNIDTSGITSSADQGDVVELRYTDQDVWLPYIDILKMNLDEANSAWLGESAEITADPPTLTDEQLRELAHHCLDRGVGAVCVTLDERGCVAFFRDGSGGVAENWVDRIEVEHVVDTTGAGDSFAGGLAYGYLAYRDYVVACQYGNAMGAQRCTGTDLNVYLSREETERQILAAYGPRS